MTRKEEVRTLNRERRTGNGEPRTGNEPLGNRISLNKIDRRQTSDLLDNLFFDRTVHRRADKILNVGFADFLVFNQGPRDRIQIFTMQ